MSGKKRINIFFCYWVPFLLYLAVIFCVSHLSEPTGGRDLPLNDKLIHGGMYALLVFIVLRAFRYGGVQVLSQRYLLWSIVFSLFYALSDEVHQYFVPGRQCSVYDYLADMAGILAGVVFLKTILRNVRGSIKDVL